MSAQRIEKILSARAKALSEIPARKRLIQLLDPNSFVEVDGLAGEGGRSAGVVTGFGSVSGNPVYVFAQDSTVDNGAVGTIQARKVSKIYDLAIKTGAPVIGVYDSNGARLEEGADALNAYGEMLFCVNSASGVVPQISLVLGACAGTAAVMACSADFMIMAEGAELFMTPPSVAKELGDSTAGAGTAGNAAKSGVAHLVAADEAGAVALARSLISLLPMNNLSSLPAVAFTENTSGPAVLTRACQEIGNADVKEIVESIVDANSVMELLADFGANAYTALATMGGQTCGVAATKGEKLDKDSCDKLAKLVLVCDAYQIPVVTLINTSGFMPSASAELSGSIRDMARLAHVYAEATTAKAAVITGEAYGAAYIALASRSANADYTVAWPSACISALEPRTAVALLKGDQISAEKTRAQVEAEYRDEDASPLTVAAKGYIDDVIDPAVTRYALLAALDILSAKRVERLPKKHSNLPL